MIHLLLLGLIFQEFPEKTTQSILRFLNLVSAVTVKLMEVTMLTLRLNVKHSTFAQLLELEVWPSTASSVLMVHSSTRTTSSVTGGSTLTAPLQRISTLSMMKLQPNVMLLQELLLMRALVPMRLLQNTLLVMKALELMRREDQPEGLETGKITDVEAEAKEGVEISEVELDIKKR